MCGIVGFVNYKKELLPYKNVLTQMTNELSKRGPDEDGYYLKADDIPDSSKIPTTCTKDGRTLSNNIPGSISSGGVITVTYKLAPSTP